MTVFTLYLLVLMLIVAGTAVDMMRHESARSRLQATNDRCVLAAADLQQVYTADWDAEDQVRDCFDKADLLGQLTDVDVIETVNSREVTATASLDIGTLFMKLVGVKTLTVPAAGTAEESVTDIEIALVLDVSGSMVDNGSTRLDNLQDAAKDFVETVLESDDNEDDPRISIALVPFNGQVNLGPKLAARYSLDYPVTIQPNVHCVDLPTTPTNVYAVQTIPTTLSLPATAWADTFTGTTRNGNYYHAGSTYVDSNGVTRNYGLPDPGNRWCQDIPGNFVALPDHSISDLKGAIDGLVGEGATSINAGMRWGMTLLDPNAQGVYNALVASGDIPNDFATPPDGDTRPFAYGRANTNKIIVLMTDGQHFPEERVPATYRTGNSPIYRSTTTKTSSTRVYSIYHNRSGTNFDYWVPHRDNDGNSSNGIGGIWRVTPWDGTVDEDTDGSGSDVDTDGTGTVTRLTWPQVWNELRMSWVAYQLYARSGLFDYATQMNVFRTRTDTAVGNTPTMDSQLTAMCNLAREKQVTVYTIAFEAPEAVWPLMEACATSDSLFFKTTTAEIDTTFNSIAANIVSLRLTQ